MSINGIAPSMGIPTSEIKKITDVGLYDPNLKGENIDCKDWEMDHVESFIANMDKDHDLFLPVGFMESIRPEKRSTRRLSVIFRPCFLPSWPRV